MPTIDRRPRARTRKRPEVAFKTYEAMHAAVLATRDNEDAWGGVRPKVARFLAQRMKEPDRALAIADAFHRKPYFMPMAPPRSRCNVAP